MLQSGNSTGLGDLSSVRFNRVNLQKSLSFEEQHRVWKVLTGRRTAFSENFSVKATKLLSDHKQRRGVSLFRVNYLGRTVHSGNFTV